MSFSNYSPKIYRIFYPTKYHFCKRRLLYFGQQAHNEIRFSIWNKLLPVFCSGILLLPDSIHFCQIVRVLPDCILFPTKPSFSNSPALSPSPYLRKLIHLTIRKNTTPFSPNNPANARKIKVSAPATRRFQHARSDKTDPHNKPSPPDTLPSTTNPNP